jgi:acyl-CoA synthetase (AMP-forming)/AMP-acid ligase II
VNAWDFLADAAVRAPRSEALSQDGRVVDYSQARRMALQLAGRLQGLGVAPGDRVGCLMHNCIEHYLAYFATAAAGAILVPLNTRLAPAEQRTILAHSTASLLLHDSGHAARSRELGVPTLDGGAAISSHTNATFTPTPSATDEPAQIYYTSGTTGDPKGVVLTHHNICTHAIAAIEELSLSGQDRWAHIAPMFHLADAWATFAITRVGGVHTFLPRFTPGAALDLLADQGITITNLVPTMLNLMVKEPGASDREFTLRVMLSGGAPIAPDVVQRILDTFASDYVQTYGMTEASPYLTMSLLTSELQKLPLAEQLPYKCKTGRPFRGIELKVVDDAGSQITADGQTVGEIRVRGATVTKGYWQNPEATADAFDAEGYLCTGDLATLDSHGYVDIVDRKKDVIKTGGELVYSIEVENVLYEHPAVLECAVYGVPDEVWGERVTAAIVLRPDSNSSAEELIAHYKAPKTVRFLASLPRTGSGKITKRALRTE